MLRYRHMTTLANASSSLGILVGSSQEDYVAVAETEGPVFTDEEALHFALERLYREGLKRPQFKVCISRSLGTLGTLAKEY